MLKSNSVAVPRRVSQVMGEVLYVSDSLPEWSQYPEGFPKLWELIKMKTKSVNVSRSTPKGFPSYGRKHCTSKIHCTKCRSTPKGFPSYGSLDFPVSSSTYLVAVPSSARASTKNYKNLRFFIFRDTPKGFPSYGRIFVSSLNKEAK